MISLLLLLLSQFPVAHCGVGRNHAPRFREVARVALRKLSGEKLRITIQLAPLTLEVVFAFQSVLIK